MIGRESGWYENSSSDDEDGTDDGGSGATSNLTPRFGGNPKQHRSGARDEDHVDETEVSKTLHVPSLDELSEVEVLDNGYRLKYSRGEWHLYDDEGRFVKAFAKHDDAVAEAYERKPWGGPRI
jgi:hypothetical protein